MKEMLCRYGGKIRQVRSKRKQEGKPRKHKCFKYKQYLLSGATYQNNLLIKNIFGKTSTGSLSLVLDEKSEHQHHQDKSCLNPEWHL